MVKNSEIVFGWYCTFINFLFILSPSLILSKYKKRIYLINLTPKLIIVINYLNCIIWTCYGFKIEKPYIAVGNFLSNIISLSLLCLLIYYLSKKDILKSIVISTIFFFISIILAFICILMINDNEILYNLCCFSTILVYAAPGVQIINVNKKNKYKLIPIYTCVFGLLASFNWTLFAFYIIKKKFGIISFFIGFMLSSIQIITYIISKKINEKGKEIIRDGKGTTKKFQKRMDKNINSTLYSERTTK